VKKKAMIRTAHLSIVKRHDILKQIGSAAALVAKKRALIMQEKSDFEMKYISITASGENKADSPFTDKLLLLEQEIKMLKTMAHNTFGEHPVKVDIPEQFSIGTSTTGVVNTVHLVQPSSLTEFTTLCTIFDEYRVTGGRFEFNLYGVMAQTTTAVGACLPMLVIAYDPADLIALATVSGGCELSKHKLIDVAVYSPTTVGFAQHTTTTLHSFAYKVPNGILDSASSGAESGSWQACLAGSGQLPYGAVKLYGSTFFLVTAATATDIAFVVNYYHVEFRIRA